MLTAHPQYSCLFPYAAAVDVPTENVLAAFEEYDKG